ncbi:hypothetical protein I6G56_14985 [Burkholderia humptydooensis]|uniref:Uncharacterized protein n=1 Tax=Burkholderia humptydooensis TaxID=430531 RepID=A0A7T2TZD0_9BURK|nr:MULTISPECIES: hypothetical protein [Burkholderia]QPS42876.1 hypothetical protein I6G56_14985 [Burkholderia humptydooensis]
MFNKGFFFLPRFFATLRRAPLLSGSGDSRRAIIGRRNGAACAPPLRVGWCSIWHQLRQPGTWRKANNGGADGLIGCASQFGTDCAKTEQH